MQDDQARAGEVRHQLAQSPHDEVVRQAVKAVAAHAGRRELARQGELLRESRLSAMEGGVEAGHLRQVWRRSGDVVDRRETVRLVKRRKRHQLGQPGPHGIIDPDRRGEGRAAMDDAMAEGHHRPAAQQRGTQPEDLRGCRAVIERRGAPAALGHDRSRAIGRAEAWREADLLDLSTK
jgi:hypothetical protein